MTKLHVLGLANLPTVAKDPVFACAYSQKLVKLCKMMKSLPDYEIIMYGVEESEVECDEFVEVLEEKTRSTVYGPLRACNKNFDIDANNLAYKTFSKNAIKELQGRYKPPDILINQMGAAYYDVCKSVWDMGGRSVESGIGYTGVINHPQNHKVFESSAWMHYIYGKYGIDNGNNYDTVIPNYFDVDDYTYSDKKEDFYLQVSRVIQRKGIQISAQVCDFLGVPLKIAGTPNEELGIKSDNVEWLGYISNEEKKELMSKAIALFQPTLYIGPFESTTIESMLSGTPVITTDFGVFRETVTELAGRRCNTFREFVEAAIDAKNFTRNRELREYAIKNYSMDTVKYQYDHYFKRIETLWGKGWYTI